MSRYVDLSKITVPKAKSAETAEDSNKLGGNGPSTYEQMLSGYEPFNTQAQSTQSPTMLTGSGETDWAFYKTIYYQQVNNNTRRFQIAYPGSNGVSRIRWRFTNNGTLPASWHTLAEQSDLASLVTLADLEQIVSLETKAERLNAITKIKAARAISLKEVQSIDDSMVDNQNLLEE